MLVRHIVAVIALVCALLGCDEDRHVENRKDFNKDAETNLYTREVKIATLASGCDLYRLEYNDAGPTWTNTISYIKCPLHDTSTSYRCGKATCTTLTVQEHETH
jgi:hypothetical protein